MTPPVISDQVPLKRWQTGSAAVAVIGWIVCLAAAFVTGPAQFYRAYFAAYLYFLGISLGCLALVMLYHLTGGAWGYVTRRILEAQAALVPLMALLFVPIALGIPVLYLWAQPEEVADSERLQSQQFYLNPTFFVIRAAICFLVWMLLAWALLARSRRQERTGDPRLPWSFQRLSEIGLVLFGTTMHFAAFDWIESLQSNFHSTIFPLLVVSGQLLSAQAFVIVAFVTISLKTDVAAVASGRALNDLGNMLFTFLILWGYMNWFQFMLSWMANQHTDASWLLPRSRGGWYVVTWALFLLNFALPMFALLLRSVKSDPAAIRWIAGLILALQLVYNFQLTMPAFEVSSRSAHAIDAFPALAIGGVWLAGFLWALGRRPLLVAHDPNRERALALREAELEESARERSVAHA